MADYAGQANAIYNPQLAADTATLNADKATTAASFTDETNSANEAYNQALKTLGDTEATGEARNNFTAANHGLASSGLVANAQRLTYGKYQEGVATTAQVRADKLAAVAGRKQAAEQGYADKLGALSSKYSGLKADYIAKNQNADAAAAAKFQQEQQLQAQRDNAAAARASAKAPTGYGMSKDSTTGGLAFHGPNGQPISVGAYYNAISGGQAGGKDVAQALSSGSDNDKKIAADIMKNNLTDAQIAKKYPWLYQ